MGVSLSMPLFVSPADVITRLQLDPNLAGTEDVVRSGIIGAQLHVQRIIDGALLRQSRECLYYLDAESFSGLRHGKMYRVEIPSGLLRTDTPLVITATSPGTAANPSSPFATYTEIDEDHLIVDYVRGYLLVDEALYSNCFLRVLCDTGYEGGETPYPIDDLDEWDSDTVYTVGQQVAYDELAYEALVTTLTTQSPATHPEKWSRVYVPVEQIPTDLYEAIMSIVPAILNRDTESKQQYHDAVKHAEIVLLPYVRTRGFSFRPL